MNDQQRAAMQMALEALEVSTDWDVGARGKQLQSMKAITALREALAEQEDEIYWIETNKALAKEIIELKRQAEQEPVGYFAYDEEHDIWEELTGPNAPGATKLYAAPVSIALQSETDSSSSSMRTTVRTKDLTDDEAQKLWNDTSSIVPMWAHHLHFARAVIAAYKEKNK